MGSEIHFAIPVEPAPKGRPRVTKKGFAFTPKKTRETEKRIRDLMQPYMPEKPLEGPIDVRIVFGRSIPKSFSKKKREDAIYGRVLPVTRPDLDNYEKLVLDALDSVAFVDDSQVVATTMQKQYSEYPYIACSIFEIDDETEDYWFEIESFDREFGPFNLIERGAKRQ